NATEQTALAAAAESSEAASAERETPAAGTPEQIGASADAAAAHAADAESATAEEEAAGSEETSKLLQEYDEKQEAATSHEVIEVKVVAYTEHGVVVDLGGTAGWLIPTGDVADRGVPRPDRNWTLA